MNEVGCPGCTASFEYNIEDYIHLCPYCSTGFILDLEEGAKEMVSDHYIIPNLIDQNTAEKSFYDWIHSRYHRPELIKKEFKILGCYGIMIPYWVIFLEGVRP